VSYSDFITLLFAFFVVMYALTQLSDAEFDSVANQLQRQFANATISNDQSPNDIGPTAVTSTLRGDDFAAEEGDVELTPSELNPSPISVNGMPLSLQSLRDELQRDLQATLEEGRVGILGNEQWLEINMGADVLFTPGDAVLSKEGRRLIQLMALRLKDMSNAIRVEGFTDNEVLPASPFVNSWALSAARAANVVQMMQSMGVEPHRLAAIGFGEYQPLTSSDSVLGKLVNRRIVIAVSADDNPRPGRAGLTPGVDEGAKHGGPSSGQPYRTWIDEVSDALSRIRETDQANGPTTSIDGLEVIPTEEGGIRITRENP
jgi:chemotaxis protein MotB